MKSMKRADAPGYDLFKLIITLILIVILIVIVLPGWTTNQFPVVNTPITEFEPIDMGSPSPMLATVELTETTLVIQTPIAPSETPLSASSDVLISPSPTATPTEIQTAKISCDTSMPSRVKIGQRAHIVNNLNMRVAPDLSAQTIQTNPIGTQVEIVDGPVCTPKGNSAYLWWKIRIEVGKEGWSAETSLNDKTYFLEPSP